LRAAEEAAQRELQAAAEGGSKQLKDSMFGFVSPQAYARVAFHTLRRIKKIEAASGIAGKRASYARSPENPGIDASRHQHREMV